MNRGAAIFSLALVAAATPRPAGAEFLQHSFSAGATMSYDSNPSLSPSGGQSIWRLSAAPSYRVSRVAGRDQFNAGLALNLERSSDEAVSNARQDPTLSLGWRRETATGDFGLSVSYEEASTRVTEFADTGLVSADGTRSTGSISGSWNTALSERLSLGLNTGYKKVAYDGGGNTDYSTLSGGATLTHGWSERADVYLRLSTSRYSPDTGRASTSRDASVGVKLRLSERLDADARIGANDSGARSGDVGITGGLSLSYALDERSSLALNLDNSVSDSGSGGFTESRQAGVQWSYAVSDRLSTGASASWRENIATPSTTTLQFGAWLSRELDDNWSLRLNYQYRRSDQGDGDEGDGHLVSLSLSYSHPDLL